jgi:hypothetical protein
MEYTDLWSRIRSESSDNVFAGGRPGNGSPRRAIFRLPDAVEEAGLLNILRCRENKG